jgi:RNA polymerase sigma-70 factor (ECF subfamily)
MTADPFEQFDGAYVLGALSAREAEEFELHLLTCAGCRARVDELSGLPDLMMGLPEHAFAVADPPPPAGLLLELQRAVRAERRRRRIYTGAVAAVVAAVLVVVTAVLARPAPSVPGATLANSVAMTPLRPAPIHIQAALTSVQWGTKIDLRCTYDYTTGASSATTYVLVVTDRAGVSQSAGTWRVTPGRVTSFSGGTSLAVADIRSVQVDLSDGTALLSLTP